MAHSDTPKERAPQRARSCVRFHGAGTGVRTPTTLSVREERRVRPRDSHRSFTSKAEGHRRL